MTFNLSSLHLLHLSTKTTLSQSLIEQLIRRHRDNEETLELDLLDPSGWLGLALRELAEANQYLDFLIRMEEKYGKRSSVEQWSSEHSAEAEVDLGSVSE